MKVWQIVITRKPNGYKVSIEGEHSVLETLYLDDLPDLGDVLRDFEFVESSDFP